jgi:predicted DNA-binding antitoxin AbrB/MazE fold protein
MSQTIRAIYENGVLRPLVPLDLEEQSEVSLVLGERTTTVAPTAAANGADRDDRPRRSIPMFSVSPNAKPITLDDYQRAVEDE